MTRNVLFAFRDQERRSFGSGRKSPLPRMRSQGALRFFARMAFETFHLPVAQRGLRNNKILYAGESPAYVCFIRDRVSSITSLLRFLLRKTSDRWLFHSSAKRVVYKPVSRIAALPKGILVGYFSMNVDGPSSVAELCNLGLSEWGECFGRVWWRIFAAPALLASAFPSVPLQREAP